MKNTILVLAIGFTAFTASAQKMKEAEVPAAIKAAFSKQYPNAKDAKWEKENGNYEAEFDNGKVETSALYTATGSLLETEIEINTSELPKTISDYVTKNLTGKKIKEASKITDTKGTITYEAEIDEADYIFDAKGNFLKKDVETADNKDKD